MDTYDSNEAMLATLKAGALGEYDVAVPGDYMVAILIQEGMLDPIADGERKNMGNIKASFASRRMTQGGSIPFRTREVQPASP